jgi:Uma2 family endonuclease
MASTLRWTSADIAAMPDDGNRYEIIDGELFVSKQPHLNHQDVCGEIYGELRDWNRRSGLGKVFFAPGIIFAEDDDVAPDLVWVSAGRMRAVVQADGKFHAAPELVVEVLSPGSTNERRDRDAKLKLYSRRGVVEYWIVSWQARQIEVYRRVNTHLQLAAMLLEHDTLESPLLPGFSCSVSTLFARLPVTE